MQASQVLWSNTVHASAAFNSSMGPAPQARDCRHKDSQASQARQQEDRQARRQNDRTCQGCRPLLHRHTAGSPDGSHKGRWPPHRPEADRGGASRDVRRNVQAEASSEMCSTAWPKSRHHCVYGLLVHGALSRLPSKVANAHLLHPNPRPAAIGASRQHAVRRSNAHVDAASRGQDRVGAWEAL